jgi:hypothetical protein
MRRRTSSTERARSVDNSGCLWITQLDDDEDVDEEDELDAAGALLDEEEDDEEELEEESEDFDSVLAGELFADAGAGDDELDVERLSLR